MANSSSSLLLQDLLLTEKNDHLRETETGFEPSAMSWWRLWSRVWEFGAWLVHSLFRLFINWEGLNCNWKESIIQYRSGGDSGGLQVSVIWAVASLLPNMGASTVLKRPLSRISCGEGSLRCQLLRPRDGEIKMRTEIWTCDNRFSLTGWSAHYWSATAIPRVHTHTVTTHRSQTAKFQSKDLSLKSNIKTKINKQITYLLIR